MQLAADSDIGRLGGRAEHVVSGRSIHFDSLDQLLGFFDRWLAERP